MQDAHVLHVGAFAAPPFEGVVGQTEVAGWKQLLPEAVAGKGPGLAHQRPDDVSVIDVGLPLTAPPSPPPELACNVVAPARQRTPG